MAGEVCVVIHQVYCDSSRGLAGGKLCHNTRNCIVTSGLLAGLLGCMSRYNRLYRERQWLFG